MQPFQSQTFSLTKILARQLIEPTPGDLFADMKQKLRELDEAQQNCKNQQEKQYLKIYANVLQRLSAQLHEVKNKYKNIDKSKLRDQKCLGLASEINFFRQQCNYLKSQISQSSEILKKQKLREQILIKQTDAIQHNIQASKNKKLFQKQRLKVLQSAVRSQFDNMTQKQKSRSKTRSFFAYTAFDGRQGQETIERLKSNMKIIDKAGTDARVTTGYKNRRAYWRGLLASTQQKINKPKYSQLADLPLNFPNKTEEI